MREGWNDADRAADWRLWRAQVITDAILIGLILAIAAAAFICLATT